MQPVALLDIFDISKRRIIKKGTPINFKLVRRLMKHGKELRKTFVVFGETGLFKDFKYIFNEEKYFTVFAPEKINEEIIAIAKKTKITKEIFEELKNIKENLPYTFRHILLVTALTIKISLDMRNNGYDPHLTALIGLMHDIGKSRVPKQILGKNVSLTESEHNILKSHSLISYLLLCYYLGDSYHEVLIAVRDHHEKLDGTGYPRGKIKMGKYAKLITPVDVFDALISLRPYRHSSFTIRQALDFLIDEAIASKIDKEVLCHLIGYVKKERPTPQELTSSKVRLSLVGSDSSYGKTVPDI